MQGIGHEGAHLDAKVPVLELALGLAGQVQRPQRALLVIHHAEGQVRPGRLRIPPEDLRLLAPYQLREAAQTVRLRCESSTAVGDGILDPLLWW